NIGAATALRLAEEGASVVVGVHTAGGAAEVVEQIVASGGRAIGVEFDAVDDLSIKPMVMTAVDTYGGLDAIFVNFADLTLHAQDMDALTVPLEVFDRAIAVNL